MTRHRRLLTIALASACVTPAAGTWAASPSSQFPLGGNVGTPRTYTLSSLSALPAQTLTATYKAAGVSVTDTYTGVSLWNLLNASGGITVNPAIKNDILRHYVVATGSDGYRAVISLGEIDPDFGRQPDLVAYGDTGGQLTPTPGPDGFARWVLPADIAGGRYVSNIVSIQVGDAPQVVAAGSGGVSSRFRLSGAVAHPGAYTLASLEGLPATTLTTTYQAGGRPVTDTYTGTSLWSLITGAGLLSDPKVKNDVLRMLVVATGSDGYEAVFSLGEIDPEFGAQPDLVAYADTAGQLGSGGADGFARLVVPGDTAGGRYVSNLVSLRVMTAVPEPGSAALLVLPAVAVGLIAAGARR